MSPPLVPLDVDLSTVTAATDAVLARGDPPEALFDVNFQANWDEELLARLLLYNALLHRRYGVAVHSILVLLRPTADDNRLAEGLHYSVWPERGRTDFQPEIVRVWQVPVDRVLTGGVGALPLALLSSLPEGARRVEALPLVLRGIIDRLQAEVPPMTAEDLWTATYVLAGLRFSADELKPHFSGFPGMKESSTYQAILREGEEVGEARGRSDEARKLLLRFGQKRFGPPDTVVLTALQAVSDLERLERMIDTILDANTWQDVLATP
jgi:hypothetical protein